MEQIDHLLTPLSVDARIRAVAQSVMGERAPFPSPIGRTRSVIYCDYFASGRSLKFVENAIRDHVLPFYANTHTTTTVTARRTMAQRERARAVIRESVNAAPNDCAVIFTGSGSTAAIVHLATTLRLYDHGFWPSSAPKPTVFVSIAEHHSNLLPWRESAANVVTIPLDATGRQIDLDELERQVSAAKHAGSPMLIGSFTAGSNLTGIPMDTRPLARIMHRHGGLAFFDYAGVGAYLDVNMNPDDEPGLPAEDQGLGYKDAVFLSPHKFIGGPGTPGVLVARKALFRSAPARPGGGSVNFVTGTEHEYLRDLEEREEAGTPAIVEAIRCGLVFRVKQLVGVAEMERREHALAKRALEQLTAHPRVRVLGETKGDRVPVFCIQIVAPGEDESRPNKFLHYNFVSAVLNDFFGIQTRGGCMCAGPFGISLLHLTQNQVHTYQTLLSQDPAKRRQLVKEPGSCPMCEIRATPSSTPAADGPSAPSTEPATCAPCSATAPASTNASSDPVKLDSLKPGYLRFSFNYFFTPADADLIVRAVTWIADHGWRLLPYYTVDARTGAWAMRLSPAAMHAMSRTKFHGLHTPAPTGDVPMAPAADSDDKVFVHAQRFADRVGAVVADDVHAANMRNELWLGYGAAGEAVEKARWFMHPDEAADKWRALDEPVPGITAGGKKGSWLVRRAAAVARKAVHAAVSSGSSRAGSVRMIEAPKPAHRGAAEDSGVGTEDDDRSDAAVTDSAASDAHGSSRKGSAGSEAAPVATASAVAPPVAVAAAS
ncbi:hypothetical protein AMAG_12183 [Allomyces macrogynus ATCC 38327]|uniref:Aminotransferase class V domain-containing protein n=1 Tax=Allomyces macrogynus (strain ATCC 38327) TaxID=578462 RepID=A0A0L0SX28_ALLM3|nr:hypothetical protein AMAG_12183 [Allomyces macrogynus ATCC 38327]|eukprot:KNE67108.1 hypothetical protein AMAG_12183 [Allomyces macrogynus ATCC 38327]